MNLFHPEIDKLLLLRADATPGVWGPTTSPAQGKIIDDDDTTYHYLKDGERGEPSWGAVVSNADPRPVDHYRYAREDVGFRYWEPGTDIYGGTMIAESIQKGNGPYIAAMNNKLPGLVETVRNLRAMLLTQGLSPILLDQIIADSMEGNDPS